MLNLNPINTIKLLLVIGREILLPCYRGMLQELLVVDGVLLDLCVDLLMNVLHFYADFVDGFPHSGLGDNDVPTDAGYYKQNYQNTEDATE